MTISVFWYCLEVVLQNRFVQAHLQQRTLWVPTGGRCTGFHLVAMEEAVEERDTDRIESGR